MTDDFDTFWNNLQTYLKPGNKIQSWNSYHGYLGDSLTIKEIHPDYISVDPPRVWVTQEIPKAGFEKIWNIWEDYQALRLERKKIKELTDSAKYIISILRWYETQAQSKKTQIRE